MEVANRIGVAVTVRADSTAEQDSSTALVPVVTRHNPSPTSIVDNVGIVDNPFLVEPLEFANLHALPVHQPHNKSQEANQQSTEDRPVTPRIGDNDSQLTDNPFDL